MSDRDIGCVAFFDELLADGFIITARENVSRFIDADTTGVLTRDDEVWVTWYADAYAEDTMYTRFA